MGMDCSRYCSVVELSAQVSVSPYEFHDGPIGFRMRHGKGGSETRRTFDDGTFTNSDGDSRSHGNNLFFRLGATYHLTDKDEFYVNGFGMFGRRYGKTTTEYTANRPDHWLSDLQISRNHGESKGAHVEWGYATPGVSPYFRASEISPASVFF